MSRIRSIVVVGTMGLAASACGGGGSELDDADLADSELADSELADSELADSELADSELADSELADEVGQVEEAIIGAGNFKVAVFDPFNAIWAIDFNGNGVREGFEVQAAGAFGQAGDIPVAFTPGIYSCTGSAATVLAVYRPSTREFRVDTNNNRFEDGGDSIYSALGIPGGGKPFVRQVVTTGTNCRSQIGIFHQETFPNVDSKWYADLNNNGTLVVAEEIVAATDFGIIGDIPVPLLHGTSNASRLAVYRPSEGAWYIDANGNNQWNGCGFGQPDRCVLAGAFGASDQTGFASPRAKHLATFVGSAELLDANTDYVWNGAPPDAVHAIGTVFTLRVLGRY